MMQNPAVSRILLWQIAKFAFSGRKPEQRDFVGSESSKDIPAFVLNPGQSLLFCLRTEANCARLRLSRFGLAPLLRTFVAECENNERCNV